VLSLTENLNINATFSFYQTPYTNKSAHYVIQNYLADTQNINETNDGMIFQVVEPINVAFQYPEIDEYTISIQHVGVQMNGSVIGGFSAKMYQQSALLVADLCQIYSIPVDRYHIIDSSEISAIGGINREGLGNTWDWSYYMTVVNYYYGRVCAFPSESQGSTGFNVYILQQFLSAISYNVSITSNYDYPTEMAVVAFQAGNNIQPSGYVGDSTWSELLSVISGLPIEYQIAAEILSQRFFYTTNNFTAALMAFQTDVCDISATPVINTKTWECMLAGCTADVTSAELDPLTGFFASLSMLIFIWLVVLLVLYIKLKWKVELSDPSKNYAKI